MSVSNHIGSIALDIETTGLHWGARVLCISAAWFEPVAGGTLLEVKSDAVNVGMSDLFTQTRTTPDVIAWVQRHLQGKDVVYFHNGSFDLPYLLRSGYLKESQVAGKVYDTLLLARMTGPHESVSLENLCQEFNIPGRMPDFYSDMKKKRAHLETCDPDAVMTYAALDTERTLLLGELLRHKAIEQYSPLQLADEGKYVLLVSKMRCLGIPLDLPYLLEQRELLTKRGYASTKSLIGVHGLKGPNDNIGLARKLIGMGVGGSLGSTKSGATAVDETNLLQLPGVKEYMDLREESEEVLKTGRGADAANDLHQIQEKMARLAQSKWVLLASEVLDGRDTSKKLGTWVDGFLDHMDDSHRIHPLWGAGGTVSYRLNCTQPNAQAVPKSVKLWGVAQGTVRIDGDLSQAELRLGAGFAGENKMALIFERGEDFHSATAEYMSAQAHKTILRRSAKSANFGGFYGGGWPALVKALGCDVSTAKEIVRIWRSTYDKVSSASKQAENRWKTVGYVVLAHGKRLWASPEDLETRIYKAFNQVVQGSVSEIIKRAMLDIDRELPEAKIVAQVHDDIKTEVPVELEESYLQRIREIMESSTPERILTRTSPRIYMKVDLEVFRSKQ